MGASVCVIVEGETLVDLFAGHADEARSRPWQRDSLVNVFSTTKGMTALCALRLVEEGRPDIDAPVARYWPEFAAAGKEDIRVRSLLSHRAGLAAIREPLPPGSPLVQGPVHRDTGPDLLERILAEPEGLLAKAFTNPPLLPTDANTRAWRAAEIPAANGHGTASALARIYGALACGGDLDGVHVLAPEIIDRARSEESLGQDLILPLVSRFGLDFQIPPAEEPLGPNFAIFGHAGAGGSCGQADPENRMSFGYTMNFMHSGTWLVDPRPRALRRRGGRLRVGS